jgi:uncharacterized MAPEG superfamily protein
VGRRRPFAGGARRRLPGACVARAAQQPGIRGVPIAVVAVARDETSTLLFWVPLVYIVVRTTFTFGYWLRINPMRSLSWLAGMICIAVLAVTVLRAGL